MEKIFTRAAKEIKAGNWEFGDNDLIVIVAFNDVHITIEIEGRAFVTVDGVFVDHEQDRNSRDAYFEMFDAAVENRFNKEFFPF